MPFLLYAVMESGSGLIELPRGVEGASVETIEFSGLTCCYSEHSILPDGNTREMALGFHRVVSSLFRQTDVVPFRFPTLLADHAQLQSELEKHATEYHDGLSRVRGCVQMEIRIQYGESSQEHRDGSAATSGTEYLQARYQHHVLITSAADTLRSAAAESIQKWRTRESSNDLRCFALIARGSVDQFRRAMAAAVIRSNLVARVSGPWPATEFLKEG